MSDPTPTGFDPTVVAQFFRTLSEFREGNQDFQRDMRGIFCGLQQDIKELRKDIQDVRRELAEGNRMFGVHEEQLRQASEWRKQKEGECQRHQALTQHMTETIHTMRQDMERQKGAAEGIGIGWKVLTGLLGLAIGAAGTAIAIHNMKK